MVFAKERIADYDATAGVSRTFYPELSGKQVGRRPSLPRRSAPRWRPMTRRYGWSSATTRTAVDQGQARPGVFRPRPLAAIELVAPGRC